MEIPDEVIDEKYHHAREEYLRWKGIRDRSPTYRRRMRALNIGLVVAMVVGGAVGILIAQFLVGLIIR